MRRCTAEQKSPSTPKFVPRLRFLGRRGSADPQFLQAEAIINGANRAFSDNIGSHFDRETSDDACILPLGASNREEAEAMVKGLERAQGK